MVNDNSLKDRLSARIQKTNDAYDDCVDRPLNPNDFDDDRSYQEALYEDKFDRWYLYED